MEEQKREKMCIEKKFEGEQYYPFEGGGYEIAMLEYNPMEKIETEYYPHENGITEIYLKG